MRAAFAAFRNAAQVEFLPVEAMGTGLAQPGAMRALL
jgi:hypothetical protein